MVAARGVLSISVRLGTWVTPPSVWTCHGSVVQDEDALDESERERRIPGEYADQ
jgi:hypothetical protein